MIQRKLAGAAVLAFAIGGLALSWVSAHANRVTPNSAVATIVVHAGGEPKS